MSISESIVKKLNKDLKDEIAMLFLDDDDPITNVKTFIPTGCTELDMIIRNGPGGGIPVGKISSLAGHEATGKSLFAMQVMANAQKMGGLCVYVDTEQGLNPEFATRVGLDLKNNFIHIGKMVCCEEVFTIIHEVCAQISEKKIEAKKNKTEPENSFALIVWDSIAATPTKMDLESENYDPASSIAVKPRILSKNLNKLLRNAQRQDVAFLFINQLRTNIGAMPNADKWIEPGGKTVPYYSSIRMRITSLGKMRDSKTGDIYGINTKVALVKNRFGPPHRVAEFPIYFSYGFDDEESIVTTLIKHEKAAHRKGGQRGTLYYFTEDDSPIKTENAMKLVEFKSKIRKDPKIREYAMKKMEEVLVRNLVDPRDIELEVVSDSSE